MAEPLVTVSGRVQGATARRLDRIADKLASRRPGENIRRSDALRVAIERGVEVLERELGISQDEAPEPTQTPKEKKPARKPAKNDR
jgi:hypothetical protein